MATTTDWENVARELAVALDSCTTQIRQMKGMFPNDAEGSFERTLPEANEFDIYDWINTAANEKIMAEFEAALGEQAGYSHLFNMLKQSEMTGVHDAIKKWRNISGLYADTYHQAADIFSKYSEQIDPFFKATTTDWENVARELAVALDSCTTQIRQMKGMFPNDAEGSFEQTLQEAERWVQHLTCGNYLYENRVIFTPSEVQAVLSA